MQPLRVYVSSTLADFVHERRVVMDWLVAHGMLPLHSYVADTDTVRDSCLADVASSDLYVLLLCHRYGSRPADDNPRKLSITQLEYEKAQHEHIPTIALLRSSIPDVALSSVGNDDDLKAVLAFRAAVTNRAALFRTEAELVAALSHGIDRARERLGPAAPARSGWSWPAPWDFSAFIADKHNRFSGRQWLHRELQDWLAAPAPQALLVCAGFGVGKSAFVSDLVRRDAQAPAEQRQVAAFHFCQHDTAETLRPSTFVRNLAAQLAARFVAYRDAVAAQPDLQALLDAAADDPGSAFEAAVLNPLHRLPEPARPQLLLVDAIDESLEARAAGAERGALLRLVAAKATRFPRWLHLVVTSRDNATVRERLDANFDLHEIDAESGENLADIEAYALARCTAEPIAARLAAAGTTPGAVARAMRDKSGGKFLYALRALDDLAAGRLDPARLAALPPGMDGFYLDAFERRFAGDGAYALAARLFGLMCVAREPLEPAAIAVVLGEPLPRLAALRDDRLADFVRPRDGCWAFDHFSLREWLTGTNEHGRPRARAFAVDTGAALQALAGWGLRTLDAQAAPPHVLHHLAAYLHDADPARLAALLADPRWLHAKLRATGPASLWPDFALAEHDPALDTLRRTLDRCAHILRRDPDQLAAQLLGRLGTDAPAGLAPLLDTSRAWRGRTWLRPLTASLAPPGALVRVLQEHTGPITSLAFAPGGAPLLATASMDGTVRLWTEGGERLAVLGDGHSPARLVLFSPDARLLLCAFDDGRARLFRPDGEAVAELVGHRRRIRHAAFSPDGRRIATGGEDHRLLIWSDTGELVASRAEHVRQVRWVAWSADGRSLVTASYDRSARVRDADGNSLAVLAGRHTRGLSQAVFAPDGQSVLTASHDNTARLWQCDGTLRVEFTGHTGAVNQALFTPDGQRVLTASSDGTARLWRLDGSLLRELKGHTRRISQALFSPHGTHILTASVDGTARLWSDAGEPLAEVESSPHTPEPAAFSADGTLVATAGADHAVRIWRVGAVAREPGGSEIRHDRITQVQASPDGTLVLARGPRRGVELRRRDGSLAAAISGQPDTRRQAALRKAAFSPDGRFVVTNTYDGSACLWHVDGRLAAALDTGGAEALHVGFDAAGTRVAAACSDGTGRVWSCDGNVLATLRGHAGAVNQVAFAPDGMRIGTAGNDATLRLWSAGGEPLAQVPVEAGGRVMRLAWSRDGRRIVACVKDGGVVLAAADGTPLRVLEGHTTLVRHLQFGPDGDSLLTASLDGLSRLWRLDGTRLAAFDAVPVSGRRSPFAADGTLLLADPATHALLLHRDPAGGAAALRLVGHEAPIAQAVWNAAGTRIASAAEDATVRLWSRDGDPLARLTVDAALTTLDWFGNALAAGDATGQLHLLEIVDPG